MSQPSFDFDWGDEAGPDGPLSPMLFQVAEAFQGLWIEHSQSLRLSVLESVTDEDDWDAVRAFVKAYGSDLFTVPFLGLSNMRGILARGVKAWLDHETEHGTGERRPKLVDAWEEGKLDRARTARSAEELESQLAAVLTDASAWRPPSAAVFAHLLRPAAESVVDVVQRLIS